MPAKSKPAQPKSAKKAAPPPARATPAGQWRRAYPDEGEGQPYLYDCWADGRGEVLLTGMHGCIERSTDAGATWTSLQPFKKLTFNAICRAPDGAIYVVDSRGYLQASRDDGKTWVGSQLPIRVGLHQFVTTPERVYAAGRFKLFHWAVGTEDWDELDLGVPEGQIHMGSYFFGPGGRHFYTSGYNPHGWLMSSADGKSWAPVELGLGKVPPLIAGAADGDSIYVGGLDGFLARSDDAGKTWKQLPVPSKKDVHALLPRGDLLLALTDDLALRSRDRGRTFEVMQKLDFNSRYERLVPSATGHVYAVGVSGLLVMDEPAFAQKLAAPRVAKAAPAPGSAAPRDAWDGRLTRLLEAWRQTRSPRVAELLLKASGRCKPLKAGDLHRFGGDTLQRAWQEAASGATPQDVPALVETLADGQMRDVEQRLQFLERLPDDPRVARGLAAWVAGFHFGATSSKPCWTSAFRTLLRTADEATVPTLAAARKAIPVKGATMRTWLEAELDKMLVALPKACAAARKPESPEVLALCSEVEAA